MVPTQAAMGGSPGTFAMLTEAALGGSLETLPVPTLASLTALVGSSDGGAV